MEALIGDKPEERKIAVASLSLALGEEAKPLLKVVSESDSDASVKQLAREALGEFYAKHSLFC